MNQLTLHILDVSNHDISLEATYQSSDQTVTTALTIQNYFTPDFLEKLEWYFEKFSDDQLHLPSIEAEIFRTGQAVFQSIFKSAAFGGVWPQLRKALNDVAVEVEIVNAEATFDFLPWEILMDDDEKIWLVLMARKFYRRQHIGKTEHFTQPNLNALFIISRPFGQEDIDFNSVSYNIIKLFSYSKNSSITILRPPTFDTLSTELKKQFDASRPYNLVHFDGHGIHGSSGIVGLNPNKGYLLFEGTDGRPVYINGNRIARVFMEFGVQAFVMNACKSSYIKGIFTTQNAASSLAQEISATGVGAVVSMKYNASLEMARLFMTEFYMGIFLGHTLAEAYAYGIRKVAEIDERIVNAAIPTLCLSCDITFDVKRANKYLSTIPLYLKRLFVRKILYRQLYDDTILVFERGIAHNEIQIVGEDKSGKTTFLNILKDWCIATHVADEIKLVDLSNVKRHLKGDKRKLLIVKENLTLAQYQDLCQLLDRQTDKNVKVVFTGPFTFGDRPYHVFLKVPSQKLSTLAKTTLIRQGVKPSQFRHHLDSATIARYSKGNIGSVFHLIDYFKKKKEIEDLKRKQNDNIFFREEPGNSNNLKLVSNIFFTIDFAKSTAEKYNGAFTSEQRKQLSILHLLHAGFDSDLEEMMQEALPAFKISATLRQLAEIGLLTFNAVAKISAVHPLILASLRDDFRCMWEDHEQSAIANACIKYIKQKQESNDIGKGKVLENIVPILGFSVESRIALKGFYELFDKLGANDEEIKELAKKGLELYHENYLKNGSSCSEVLVFIKKLIGWSVGVLNLEETAHYFSMVHYPTVLQSLSNFTDTGERRFQLIATAEILILFLEFEELAGRVIKLDRYVLTNLDFMLKFSEELKQLHLWNYLAKVQKIIADAMAFDLIKIKDWYFSMNLIRTEFSHASSEITKPLLRYYLDNLPENRSGSLINIRHAFLKTLSGLTIEHERLAAKLEDRSFAEIVLTAGYKQIIETCCDCYNAAYGLTDDVNTKTEICDRISVMKCAIECKLKFYRISHDDLQILFAANTEVDPIFCLSFLKRPTDNEFDREINNMCTTVISLLQFEGDVNIKDHSQLVKKSLVEGDYQRVLQRLNQLNPDRHKGIERSQAIIEAVELIVILYYYTNASSHIKFFGTHFYSYLAARIDELLNVIDFRQISQDYIENLQEVIQKYGRNYKNQHVIDVINQRDVPTIVKHLTEVLIPIKMAIEDYYRILQRRVALSESEIDACKRMVAALKGKKSIVEISSPGESAAVEARLAEINELEELIDRSPKKEDELESSKRNLQHSKAFLTLEYLLWTLTSLQIVNVVDKLFGIRDLIKKDWIAEANDEHSELEIINLLKKYYLSQIESFYQYVDITFGKENTPLNNIGMARYTDLVIDYFQSDTNNIDPTIIEIFAARLGTTNLSLITKKLRYTIKLPYLIELISQTTKSGLALAILNGTDRSSSQIAWKAISDIENILKEPEVLSKTLHYLTDLIEEYQVHWAIIDALSGAYTSLNYGECQERLKLLNTFYLVDGGRNFSEHIPNHLRSVLVRNVGRKKLFTAIENWQMYFDEFSLTHNKHVAEYTNLLKEITNEIYE